MNNIDENFARKFNMKLFPIYKMISWDLLFYYAISFLFLTDAKGISASAILFADSFYPIFKFLFQIPCTTMVDKIGKRKSLIIANISVALYVLILILSNGVSSLIFANFFCAFGFITKSLCESNLLYDSIPKSEKRRSIFSKLDGKGSSYYYYFDAITSSITGFLFVFNPYLPMFICLFFCLISIFIAYRFCEINKNNVDIKSNNESPIVQLKSYLGDLKSSFKFIFRSRRLQSLLLFYGFFAAVMTLLTTYRRSLMKDIGIPSEMFGIIFAAWGILSGFTAGKQEWFHKKFKNKTLSYLSVPYVLSCLIIGLLAFSSLPSNISVPFILALFSLHYIIKGPFWTLIKRYFSSFSTSKNRTKIYAAKDLIESIVTSAISFLGSYLLDITTTTNSFIIIGILFSIILFIILNFMKNRVGLKPEEYKKSDIEFTEIK